MFLCFQIILSNTCRVKSQSITRLTSGEVSIVGAPPCRVSDCLTPQRLEMEHGQNFCTMFEPSAFFSLCVSFFISFYFIYFRVSLQMVGATGRRLFVHLRFSAKKEKRLCWLFLSSGLLAGVQFYFSPCVQKHLNANFDAAFDSASIFRHFFHRFFLKKKAVKLSTRHRRSHPSPNIFIEKNVARTSH